MTVRDSEATVRLWSIMRYSPQQKQKQHNWNNLYFIHESPRAFICCCENAFSCLCILSVLPSKWCAGSVYSVHIKNGVSYRPQTSQTHSVYNMCKKLVSVWLFLSHLNTIDLAHWVWEHIALQWSTGGTQIFECRLRWGWHRASISHPCSLMLWCHTRNNTCCLKIDLLLYFG